MEVGVPPLALCLTFLCLLPPPCLGQDSRTVGIHAGILRSRQLWDGPMSTSIVTGITVGVNVEVPTPASFLSIRAGLEYNRYGSAVRDGETGDGGSEALNVRSHYLGMPILGKASARAGPVGAFVFLGPTLALLLETECTRDLCRVLHDERATVLALATGAGLSVGIGDRFRGEAEVRLSEGLTAAYRATDSEVRYRSVEVLFRVRLPF